MSALFATTECSGLVAPAGGRLVDLRAGGEERRRLLDAAPGLPTLRLGRRGRIDLTLLAHGAYSPLDRFLGEAERRSVLDDLCLADGSFFPMPVTLEVPESVRSDLHAASCAALRSGEDELLGVLEIDESYEAGGRTFVAGRPRVVETPVEPAWRRFHWTPRETRECLDRYARAHVVAFEGDAGEIDEERLWDRVDALEGILLVHPPGTPSPELEALARTRRDRACVAVLPWVVPGPDVSLERQLLTRALVHRNFGASHLLVPGQRDDALGLLERSRDATGITPVPLEAAEAVAGGLA